MIKDKLATFADNIAATSAGVLGNVIDLEKSGLNVGAGQPLYLVITATTDVTGGPAQLSLVTSDNENLSAGTTLVTVPVAAGAEGMVFAAVSLPVAKYKRYLGVSMGGTALTVGNLDVSLALDVPTSETYPKG